MPEISQRRPANTGFRSIPAGGGIAPHWHEEHQIVYAGRGVLSVTTEAGSWVAPANRAIWVPAGTLHQHRAYGDTALHTIGLRQNPLGLDTPSALTVSPLLRELILAYTSDAGEDTGIRSDGAADRRPRHGTPGERRRLLAVLLDQLRRSPQRPTYLPAPRDPRLAAVCGLLENDPADNRTLTELGREIGASERTLSRLCKTKLGMTFPQWRTELRLHHALRLLADGESVTRVAHQCGWASTSAFIDTFRRAYGHTPGSRSA
ncbi:AraC family transcriptional regulator [Kribbella turkmenica]|uniref:HTH-type transcriptional regulator RipA n=1 Tax=Kribbella turkmenica TaxID=2530375 RepID=A0A4R4XGM9_9ACTN|nr:helix-turn-helix transcriptional regulator [Kribbella turkmenica]TDD29915.1 AraC family transcriptional regulator [Kribbella turkmenica]